MDHHEQVETIRKQMALVGENLRWRHLVREARHAQRAGTRGAMVWVIGQIPTFRPAEQIARMPWPNGAIRAALERMVATYDPTAQIVFVTITPSEILVGTYHFDGTPAQRPPMFSHARGALFQVIVFSCQSSAAVST